MAAYDVSAHLGKRAVSPAARNRSAVAPGGTRIGGNALSLMTRQLATLARVVPLEEALRTVAMQIEKETVRRVLLKVHTGLIEGFRLSEAMARQGRAFPPLYRAMIAAGESSGALPEILDRLADLLERQQQIRGKVQTALIYPAALAATAMAVVIALMTFVVPRVVEQFESMHRTLPLLTRIVIFLSESMRNWGWLFLVLLAATIAALVRGFRDPAMRRKADALILRLPLVGKLIRDVGAARLARTLATMTASGLPVVEGLNLTSRTLGNTVLCEAVEKMAIAVREGGSLSAAMRQAGVFPPVLMHMTASGEASGRLSPMLASAADYLERDFHTFTSMLLSLLEPAIIIIMGALVTVIVLSILLPILQINTLTLR
jgi:general secretion pathway protein F